MSKARKCGQNNTRAKKSKILFTFGKYEENWPSDDTDDSDYEPQQEVTLPRNRSADSLKKNERKSARKSTIIKQTKRKSAQQDGTSKKHFKANDNRNKGAEENRGNHNNSLEISGNAWGSRIPPEVLLQIFTYVVESSGAIPFLPRACRVCRLWNGVSIDQSLWKDVDLSFGYIKREEAVLRWLCETRLGKVTRINLTGWKVALNDENLQYLSEHCPHIEDLDIQGCMKVQTAGLCRLIDACPKLRALDLSGSEGGYVTGQTFKSDILIAKNLCHIMEKMNCRLVSLSVANQNISGVTAVLRNLALNCKMLTKLNLSNIIGSELYIDIEAFQEGCPQLRVLNLNCTPFRCTQRFRGQESPGFPELRELRMCCKASESAPQGPSDNILHRWLANSVELKVLDIRCCNLITALGLVTLGCEGLTHLYVTWTRVPCNSDVSLVFSKWSHSLVEVDIDRCLSYCKDFPYSVSKLSRRNSNLETINLANSNINMNYFKTLMVKCRQLKTIDVSSCRSLNAGYKRRYSGTEELQKLRIRLGIKGLGSYT